MTETPRTPAALNGATGREQLAKAFANGAEGLQDQVRYILALSQVIGVAKVPPRTPPRSIRAARYLALTHLADLLEPRQIQMILLDINRMPDAGERLPLLALYSAYLPEDKQSSLIHEIWQQLDAIQAPAQRAEALYNLVPLLATSTPEPTVPPILLQVRQDAALLRSPDARIRSLVALLPHLPEHERFQTARLILDQLATLKNDVLCAKALGMLIEFLPSDLEQRALTIAWQIGSPAERAQALTHVARHMPPALQRKLHLDALEAIDSIMLEESRAEALIEFVPQLEVANPDNDFPQLLERALTITIMFTRRQLRARVLAALAPHLTPDLQGEALAAVHSLPNERERALLLTHLAPHLSQDMLVASLAVALTMRERDARVQALVALARHLPKGSRQRALDDALVAIKRLPNAYERVRSLLDLLDLLSDTRQHTILEETLDKVDTIENETARARVLNLLGGNLPPHLQQRAVDLSRALQDPQHRLNALLGLVEHVSELLRHDLQREMIKSARQLPLEYKQARALTSIIPHLNTDALEKIAAFADDLQDPIDRVSVYISIIQNVPPAQRGVWVAKVWAQLSHISEGYDRANALAALAPYMPAAAARDLTAAIQQAIRDTPEEYDRASAIVLLAPLISDHAEPVTDPLPSVLAALKTGLHEGITVADGAQRIALLQRGVALWLRYGEAEQSFALWQQLAQSLIKLSMPDVLLCLGALTPLIRQFAGETGLRNVAYLLGVR